MRESVPLRIKLYHIIHVDRLSSILQAGQLWSDAEVQEQNLTGTNIGMPSIKARRLLQTLTSYPELHVGECVPFYFCPRSVMLYLFYRNNHDDISYRGGQEPIIHLVLDLMQVIDWAVLNKRRWVFTDSNAGSHYFNDYNKLLDLNRIDWSAVQAKDWQNRQEQKQAEFLVENQVPFRLIESIGVYSSAQMNQVQEVLHITNHKPKVEIKRDWYY